MPNAVTTDAGPAQRPVVPGAAATATLHVCTTCRAGIALCDGDVPQGQKLFDAVAVALAAEPGAPVLLRPSNCMANCERGCSAALSADGKWQYLLADLQPEMGTDLVVYGRAYAATTTGTVMPSKRPASLRHVILGRVPPFVPSAPAGATPGPSASAPSSITSLHQSENAA